MGKNDEKSNTKGVKTQIDYELDALRDICNAIEGITDDGKARIFKYLKDKYRKSFPTED
jgi:hypothetical protein